ncbi:MAG TPA: VWA domain-containing protein [Vicinamibacterales bacterium]|nr:VWA domain-containing protein [Vicinamibacterales bacterium]
MRKSALVPAILALTALAQAQAPPPVSPLPSVQNQSPNVFRTSASMVALNVTVTDGEELVTGLSAGDFEVYEDGVQQSVRFFETSDVPMDVILLLDASSSMRSRMPVVHDAAKGFMQLLRSGDRGAVVAFSDNVRFVQDLTSDPAAIEVAINSTVASGSTSLHNAIYVALKQFGRTAQAAGEVRRQAIAVLSDGEDTSSLVSFDDVLALARRMGVNIYTIGLQSESASMRQKYGRGFFSASDYAMRTLAKETGARAFFPMNVYDLKNVYGEIAEELGAQYSIAYSPTNARQDGRFRRIVVRVTADPDFHPRARSGYTAGPTRAGAGMLAPQLR